MFDEFGKFADGTVDVVALFFQLRDIGPALLDRHASLFDAAILKPALVASVTKLNPRELMKNPVMFTVEMVALAATVPADNAPPGFRHALERVYHFTDGAQINVFPSVPTPVGPASTDRAYSPLWRMVEVAWLPGATRRVLTSEEAVLDAVERGQLSLRITRVVVNCAVVSDANGGLLPGARLQR